jgi:DNA-binding MarR family transcriptional regulator
MSKSSDLTSSPQAIVRQIAAIRELANGFIETELNRLEIVGIVPAHGSILAFLFKQDGPVPIKDIVACVGRTKSTVTGMLQTLEQHGYIERMSDLEDHRVTFILLTEKGRNLREPFRQISENLLQKVYGKMPANDRKQLMTWLLQIENNLKI